MAAPNVWAPVIAEAAKLGLTVAPELQAKLDKYVEPMLDADANQIVTAIADHIHMNGIAGMMDNSLKNALIGSEPTIDSVLNGNVDTGYEYLVGLVQEIAKSAPAS